MQKLCDENCMILLKEIKMTKIERDHVSDRKTVL